MADNFNISDQPEGGGAATKHDSQQVSATSTTDRSVASFADVASMTLTTKDLGAAGTYVVIFNAQFSADGDRDDAEFQLVVGGVVQADSLISAGAHREDLLQPGNVTLAWRGSGIAASVIIKVQWLANISNGTLVRLTNRRLIIDGILDSNVIP